MPGTKIENKVEELEGLVLANRYGARSIWNGFMISVLSTLLPVVVILPMLFWVVSITDRSDDGSIVFGEGGEVALVGLFVLIAVSYIATIAGVVKMILGFYRMAHPEKYAAKILREETKK